MVKLTKAQIVLAKKLYKIGGRATADMLESSYPYIEPLIRRNYITVVNEDGTAVYVMTPAGQAWAAALKEPDQPK